MAAPLLLPVALFNHLRTTQMTSRENRLTTYIMSRVVRLLIERLEAPVHCKKIRALTSSYRTRREPEAKRLS